MKRFLSIILTVILVLSSFVMASATDDTFSVIEVDGTINYPFGEIFDGYFKISADVYVTQGVTEAILVAKNGKNAVGTAEFDEKIVDTWQTVEITVKDASVDSVDFTSKNGKIYVKAVKVEKAMVKTLVFEEDFDKYYNVDEDVVAYNYTKANTTNNSSSGTTINPLTQFKVKSGIKGNNTQVATLFSPYYTSNKYERRKDDGLVDFDTILEPCQTIDGKDYYKAMEYYNIGIDHAEGNRFIVEIDLYNAANAWEDDEAIDTFMLTLGRMATKHSQANDIPGVLVSGTNMEVKGKRDDNGNPQNISETHNVPIRSWNKLTVEFERSRYDSNNDGTPDRWLVETTATYGDKTIKNNHYRAYADDLGNLILSVDYKAGGRFYVDNLKVYRVNGVEDAYINRYSEDFETGYSVGDSVKRWTVGSYKTQGKEKYLTFKVSESENGNKYGKLRNTAYTYSDVYKRYDEDGKTGITTDTKETSSDNNREYMMYEGAEIATKEDAAEGDIKKVKISFRYKLPGSVVDASGNVKENLIYGATLARFTHLESSYATKQRILADMIKSYNNSDNISAWVDTKNLINTSKKWMPVTMRIEGELKKLGVSGGQPNNRYTYNVTTSTTDNYIAFPVGTTAGSAFDASKILFGMNPDEGGIAFIDDIKIETAAEVSEWDSLNPIFETVYKKSAVVNENQKDDFVVNFATFSENSQSINIVKKPGAAEKVQVVAALYKGGVLESAAINEVDTSSFTPFKEEVAPLKDELIKVCVGGEYNYKVFVFNTKEELRPLADMYIKAADSE